MTVTDTLPPGSRVERFTVEEVLARGASSITYRASESGTGRLFMLREFVPGGLERAADGSFGAKNEQLAMRQAIGVAQFLADAARSQAMNHPAISRVSRWFKANGTAYMVMGWAPGKTLATQLEGAKAMPAVDIVNLAMPLLDALDYLHAQDLTCRELDPQHILVVDLGGAVLMEPGAGAESMGGQAGSEPAEPTNAYAPIERSGAGGKVGPWTDIYGLAACFYRCLYGQAPPPAARREAAVRAGSADPLVFPDLPAGAAQADLEIRTLAQRGLVLEPTARPQTVREWRARIAPSPEVGGAGVPADGEAFAPERRQWLPIFLLALFLAGIGGIAWYLFTDGHGGVRTGPAREEGMVPDGSVETAEEAERWRQALEADAVITYREFLADFPQSRHLPQAREHIDRLEDQAWLDIVAENTQAAYEAHLEMFPEGRHVAEARARIEEFRLEAAKQARELAELQRRDEEAWLAARTAGTTEALDGYIAAWPGGAHLAEAHDLRRKMQGDINDHADFRIAAMEHTIEAYRSYIRNYPAGRHVAEAQEAVESLTLRPGKTFRDCTTCPLMAVVPAGAYWQGSAENSALAISLEKPRHRVVIADPFAVSVHEITMAEWDACAAAGGCDARPDDNGWGREDRPVMMVSWNDAMQYAGWLSEQTGQVYSLPSESQWEYAARAGEEGDWPGGSPAAVCDYGNIAAAETTFEWRHTGCSDNSAVQTMPAGSYRPNAFGLYDVIGNVAEWTLDCMNLSYLEAPSDGSAWSRGMCSSRITRGGSWFTGTKESRLPARFNLKNGDRNDFTGFRVVRRVEKQ